MGVVFLLIACVAVLVGIQWLPVLQDMVFGVSLNTTEAAGTPLVPIVGLFPIFALVIIIIAIAWMGARKT